MSNATMQQEVPRPDIPEVKPPAPEEPGRIVPQPEIRPEKDPPPVVPPPERPAQPSV